MRANICMSYLEIEWNAS